MFKGFFLLATHSVDIYLESKSQYAFKNNLIKENFVRVTHVTFFGHTRHDTFVIKKAPST